jgi:hypothetical protein
MLIAEIVFLEDSEVEAVVLDLLTAMAGEGLDSTPMSAIIDELNNQGIDIDEPSLFDVLENLAIVDNVKDSVVYFNTDSDASHYGEKPDPEKQDKTVDKMARKQVKKGIKK